MSGPYPPYPPAGSPGPPFGGQSGSFGEPAPYPGGYQPGYPGQLPPPVGYSPPPRRRRLLWWLVGVLAALAMVGGAVVAVGGGRPPGGSAVFTEAAAKSAIQNYLTALSESDTETIARNGSCGLFDAIKDKKSDLALARLASDAFRKQFSRAEVTSIDEIVLSSSYQAQVLFTMKVARTSSRTDRDEEQGVAQLLRQDNKLLVCSYLLRTTAQY